MRILWRSLRQPAYRKRLKERLGFYPIKLEKCIWIHAVSMGETIAAVPLIKSLQKNMPHTPILITSMTPTGAKQVKTIFGDSVYHVYLPYDLSGAVKRFYHAMNPIIGVIIETELWPNLIAIGQQKKIPLCLVNARLSERSMRGYKKVASLTRSMLQQLTIIAAHGQADAERFIALGAQKEKVIVTGNIKFDLELNHDLLDKVAALRALLGADRFIWIAASTHEGEEEIILEVHKQIRVYSKDALLILVPRHPNRFDAIAKLAGQSFNTVRRSQTQPVTAETAVYLGDTMGELLLLYGVADVAFVGGSLIPRGGHNMLEPAALGKPILTGTHVFNFKEISQLFIAEKALTKVADIGALTQELKLLILEPPLRTQRGAQAKKVMKANSGALLKQLEIINAIINEADS